ncbi:hypothetical protein [Marinomonas algarum]|uniref:Uncharacterized protein n=1 Tax=Marinomonas algarum TaxID=2883105 RepID=A0A9X1INY5_9GAMM|nr:hypothetical protein [Marinomonas algarum]MCB5162909.1 hypothetical protein [Marinomonas algarum]
MKKNTSTWVIALLCAVLLHIAFFSLSDKLEWLTYQPEMSAASVELFLLPERTPIEQSSEQANPLVKETDRAVSTAQSEEKNVRSGGLPAVGSVNTTHETTVHTETAFDITPNKTGQLNLDPPSDTLILEEDLTLPPQSSLSEFSNQQIDSKKPHNQALNSDEVNLTKPDLLDLSNVSLAPNTQDAALTEVFSKELRDKIAESQEAQQNYSKGLNKEVDYPITEDADGTRYVNIKGVCWRLPPEENAKGEGWAIVFDGCGIENKLFHFELNISPTIFTNELLGPDSPFNIDQPIE